MKTLYLDLGMGAAGDMLSAALFELIDDKEKFLEEINNLGFRDLEISAEKAEKCGIQGTHFNVTYKGVEEDDGLHEHHHHHEHEHEHNHEHIHEHEHSHEHDHEHGHEHGSVDKIRHIVEGHLDLNEKVKKDILGVFGILADAESRVHGVPVSEIHFHEVGTMDAIADIASVCMLIDRLEVGKIIASPVTTGFGEVRCAHGILPVPAPATANILKGIPVKSGDIRGEMCTPTGAALVRYFAGSFGQMPEMTIEKTGYGMGKRDFERANCVRAFLGETRDKTDDVTELRCNLDDMTAEEMGFALEALYDEGALEAFYTPATMKKSRPGMMLTVLCREEDREKIVRAIFRHTSTIGIRENICRRYVLDRSEEKTETPYGEIRSKVSEGYGTSRIKYEYDDLSKAAKENGVSIREILESIKRK